MNPFSEQTNHVLRMARNEVMRFNHEVIDTEHVLLAMVKHVHETPGLIGEVFSRMNIDPRRIRLEVEKQIESPVGMFTMVQFPSSPTLAHVIELAKSEALRAGLKFVRTEHLLIGLLLDQEGVAGQVLRMLGFDANDVRRCCPRFPTSAMQSS